MRVTKLRGGLPWLPTAVQPGHCGHQLARSFKGAGLYTCCSVRIGTSQAPGEAGILVLESNMAQRKRSRQETSSATADAPTTMIGINETHAVQLARHLAELYKRRRFTDLKVR